MISRVEATKAERDRRTIQMFFAIGIVILGPGTMISVFSANLIAVIICGLGWLGCSLGWLALAFATYDRRRAE
jgi:hypothetical protein